LVALKGASMDIEAIEEGATREEAAERHPCEAEFAST
jgi:hypothetical protein